MTTHPAAPAVAAAPAAPDRSGRTRAPLRILLTILHLGALGVAGLAVSGALLSLIGLGIGLIPLLGIGLPVLAGAVYALYGVAWFEQQRVVGLYELDLAPLRLRPREAPGFTGWLRALLRQSVDGGMWRALAGFLIAGLIGVVAVVCAQRLLLGIIALVSAPRGGDLDASAMLLPLWIALLIGAALLHRLVAVAIIGAGAREAELTERVRERTEQRAGAVRAADVERTRIERDLHDGVQPRLVSVGMTLGLAQQKIDDDPQAAKALIAEAHASTKAAITELRQLARGIYASVLDDRGLDAALSALAARSHIPVQLDVRIDRACGRDAQAAVYFAIAESLTNAAKHSRGGECRVAVRTRDDGTLWARIEDDGIGGARVQPGGGLDGVVNRVLAAGGTSRLDSPQGGPTALEVIVPCAS